MSIIHSSHFMHTVHIIKMSPAQQTEFNFPTRVGERQEILNELRWNVKLPFTEFAAGFHTDTSFISVFDELFFL